MIHTYPSAEVAVNRSRWIWLLTLTVAGLPVIFGLYQNWIFFDEAFPHLYYSRTLPSLAAVALGFVGIAAPIGIWLKRNSFRRWSRARQWGAFGAVLLTMFLFYLLPFVVLINAGRNSRAILAYTPSVNLIFFEDGEDLVRWGVAGGPGTGHGSGHFSSQGKDRDYFVEWHAPLEPPDLPRAPNADPFVHLSAQGTVDPVKLDLKIENGQTVLFKALGFRNAVVSEQGKPVTLPIELNPGTHRFTIETMP